MNPGWGANAQPLGKAGVSAGFHTSHSSRMDTSKSWEPFSAPHQENLNPSSFSFPLDATSQRNKELASLSEPLSGQGRPSPLVPGARMATTTIEIPGPTPLPPLIQASQELFPVAIQRKSGSVVNKGRKINKEKLKAVLAAIDCFEDNDMEEATSDPPSTLHDPLSTTPGRPLDFAAGDSLQYVMRPVVRDTFSLPEYDSDASASSTSGASNEKVGPSNSIDLSELNDSIFSWDSYDSFTHFCGKIGINLRNNNERKDFLNSIRSQHSLPPVDLDSDKALIDLFGDLSV